MEHTPEEFARRALQMRPANPKPRPDERDSLAVPTLKPKFNAENRLTPEQRAKKALGLQPFDPMPQPKDMSPQMQEALSKLDPNFQVQVLGVMGSLQQFQNKAQSLSEKIEQNMDSAIERTQKTSLAQRAIIRRAHRGTLGQKDVELARGIIADQGAAGAIDPKKEGLYELVEQREELMGAAQEMHALLEAQMPKEQDQFGEKALALAIVDQAVMQQAGSVSNTVDRAWGGYQQSDMLRIQAIVEGRDAARIDQAATHRPVGV